MLGRVQNSCYLNLSTNSEWREPGLLLGTPQPEVGCNRKLWQEAGMSSYTYCTVISSSAQLSPGCTSVQVLRYHIMNGHSSLELSTSCKSPWKSRGSPTELCPTTADVAGGTLGIKSHPMLPEYTDNLCFSMLYPH